jgi:hypothetical protein
MNNIIDNYEPNNELFKHLMLAVLCVIGIVYYSIVKALGDMYVTWYDSILLVPVAALAAYSGIKIYKLKRRNTA